MNRKDIRSRIQEIGIIPSVRVSSAEDARFVAETLSQGGIPIAEIAMTVPGALRVISDLVKGSPDMIVGAGSLLDAETARRCVDAVCRSAQSHLAKRKQTGLAKDFLGSRPGAYTNAHLAGLDTGEQLIR